jgi:hypothetical protein
MRQMASRCGLARPRQAGVVPASAALVLSLALTTVFAQLKASRDDGRPDLPSGDHAELPGSGQRDYFV